MIADINRPGDAFNYVTFDDGSTGYILLTRREITSGYIKRPGFGHSNIILQYDYENWVGTTDGLSNNVSTIGYSCTFGLQSGIYISYISEPGYAVRELLKFGKYSLSALNNFGYIYFGDDEGNEYLQEIDINQNHSITLYRTASGLWRITIWTESEWMLKIFDGTDSISYTDESMGITDTEDIIFSPEVIDTTVLQCHVQESKTDYWGFLRDGAIFDLAYVKRYLAENDSYDSGNITMDYKTEEVPDFMTLSTDEWLLSVYFADAPTASYVPLISSETWRIQIKSGGDPPIRLQTMVAGAWATTGSGFEVVSSEGAGSENISGWFVIHYKAPFINVWMQNGDGGISTYKQLVNEIHKTESIITFGPMTADWRRISIIKGPVDPADFPINFISDTPLPIGRDSLTGPNSLFRFDIVPEIQPFIKSDCLPWGDWKRYKNTAPFKNELNETAAGAWESGSTIRLLSNA